MDTAYAKQSSIYNSVTMDMTYNQVLSLVETWVVAGTGVSSEQYYTGMNSSTTVGQQCEMNARYTIYCIHYGIFIHISRCRQWYVFSHSISFYFHATHLPPLSIIYYRISLHPSFISSYVVYIYTLLRFIFFYFFFFFFFVLLLCSDICGSTPAFKGCSPHLSTLSTASNQEDWTPSRIGKLH